MTTAFNSNTASGLRWTGCYREGLKRGYWIPGKKEEGRLCKTTGEMLKQRRGNSVKGGVQI
jgi:hypothetical protein